MWYTFCNSRAKSPHGSVPSAALVLHKSTVDGGYRWYSVRGCCARSSRSIRMMYSRYSQCLLDVILVEIIRSVDVPSLIFTHAIPYPISPTSLRGSPQTPSQPCSPGTDRIQIFPVVYLHLSRQVYSRSCTRTIPSSRCRMETVYSEA